ncbi:hypothetical protein PICSAR47_03035 [Mycobacterium avium subsp. paratuberculosis]|nr:hypothetical protein PICSAR47_03035 [Mycobacterium avium subsp. paratuberculosis]
MLCCLPLGIVSIVYSTKVSGLWAQGRYAEAQASADSAKKWVIWSAAIGVVVGIIYGILMAVQSRGVSWRKAVLTIPARARVGTSNDKI